MVSIALYIGLLITKHLGVMIAIWFLFGALSSVRMNIGYVYLMEMLPEKWQTPITSIWNVQEAFIYVLATLYFWKISTHWFYFVVIGLGFNIISVVLLFFLPESPRYLVTVKKFDEAKAAFEVMARFNRKNLEWNDEMFVKKQNLDYSLPTLGQTIEATSPKPSLDAASQRTKITTIAEEEGYEEKGEIPPASYFLKQPKILANTIIMSFVWLASSFGYYLILSLTNTFDHVYISAFTSSFSEMVAYVVAGVFYLKIGVKLSLILAFAMSTLGGILILIWGLNNQDSPIFFIFFLFAKFILINRQALLSNILQVCCDLQCMLVNTGAPWHNELLINRIK